MGAATYAIVLFLGAHQFVGIEEYNTYRNCISAATIITLNTPFRSKCVPNVKNVPDATHDERINPFTEDPEEKAP